MRAFLVLALATTACGVAPLAAVFAQKEQIGDTVYAIGVFNGFPATNPTTNNPGKSNLCAFLAAFVGETCPMCYKPVFDGVKTYGGGSSSFRRTPGVSVLMGVNNVPVCAWCAMAGATGSTEFAGSPNTATQWEMNGGGGRFANNAIVAFATLPAGKTKCPCQDPSVNNAANNPGKTCFNYYTDNLNSVGRVTQGFASGSTTFTLAPVWVPNDSVCETTTAEVPFNFAAQSYPVRLYNLARDATKTDVITISTTEGVRCVASACSDRTNACRAAGGVTDQCCKARTPSPFAVYNNYLSFSNGCRASSAGDVCVPDCSGAAGWRSWYQEATLVKDFFVGAPGLKNFVDPAKATPLALKNGGYIFNTPGANAQIDHDNEYWACLFAPFLRERGCFPADVLSIGSKCVASQLSNSAILFDNAPVDYQGKYVDTGITYIA